MSESRVPRYVPRETITPQGLVSPTTMGEQIGTEVQRKATEELGTLSNQALETNRYMLSANVAQKINELYTNAVNLNDPELGMKQFNAGYQGFAESIINTTPAQNQAFARNVLVHASNNATMRLETQVIKQKKADAFMTAMDTFDQNRQSMYSYNKNGDEAGGLTYYSLANQQLNDMIKSGIIGGGEAQKLGVDLRKQLYSSKYIGEFLAAKKYDKANNTTTATDFMKNFPVSEAAKELTDKDIFQIESIFKNYNLLDKQAIDFDKAHYNEKVKQIVFHARKTGEGGSAEDLASLYAYKPKDYDLVQKQIETALAIHANVAEVNQTSLGNIANKLIEQQNATTEAKTLDEQRIAAGSVNDLKNLMSEIQKDPYSYTLNNPLYKKMKQNDLYKSKYTDTQIMLAAQQNAGIPTSQLSVQSLGANLQDIATIKSLPISEGVQYIEQKKKQFPNTFNYYMQGISGKNIITGKTGIPTYYNLLTNMSETPAQKPYLQDAINAFSTKTSELNNLLAQAKGIGFKPENIDTEIIKNHNIQRFVNMKRANATADPSFANDITSHVYNLAAWYLLNDKDAKLSTISTTVQKAFDVLYGDRYPVIDRTYAVPFTEDYADVKNMMVYLDKNVSQIFNLNLNAKTLDEQKMNNKILGGHWINNPANDEEYIRVEKDGISISTPKGFDIFGKHIDRPYLYFTKEDLSDPEFQRQTYEQKKAMEEGLIEKIFGMEEKAAGLVGKTLFYPLRSLKYAGKVAAFPFTEPFKLL